VSNYTQITFFAPKDALLSGNPAKLIKGADIDPELAAIATAIASKLDGSSFANPTGTIGLTAVNGTATTPMRSDAAPALSQAISPTWSGTHTFSNAITVNGAGSSLKGNVTFAAAAASFGLTLNGAAASWVGILFQENAVSKWGVLEGHVGSGTLSLFSYTTNADQVGFAAAGNVTIYAPSSGVALTANGVAGSFAALISGSSTSGQSDGLRVQAGTNVSDVALAVYNQANTVPFVYIRGDGSGQLGPNNTNTLSWGTGGNFTLPAPTSGIAFTVSGASSATALSITGSIAVNGTPVIAASVGSAGSPSYGWGTQQAGMYSSATNNIDFSTAGVQRVNINASGILSAVDDGGTLTVVGWRGTPVNLQGGSYTAVLADRGKMVRFSATATFTVNSGIFQTGDVLTVAADASTTLTIAAGAGITFFWANGTNTTGNRTLTGVGIATLVFVNSTSCYVTGSALT